MRETRAVIQAVLPALSVFLRIGMAVMLAASLFLLLSSLSKGFDMTDGSMYLLLADQPENMRASVTQFGHYTNLLYRLSGGSVAAFNLLGLLVLLGVGLFFFVALDHYWLSLTAEHDSKSSRYTTLVALAAATLSYYHFWLLSPSYNWLALIAIFLVGTGSLRAVSGPGHGSLRPANMATLSLSSALIGLGGGLAFLAKPTTAAILGATCLLWILCHGPSRSKVLLLLLSALIAVIVLLMHALLFRGGIASFIAELALAAELANLLGAGHGIKELAWQVLIELKHMARTLVRAESFAFLGMAAILSLVFRWRNLPPSYPTYMNLAVVTVGLIYWLQLLFRQYGLFMQEGKAALALSLYFMAAALIASFQNSTVATGRRPSYIRLLVLFSMLFLLQLAYAFGSANGLLHQMSGAIVFLYAAILFAVRWIEHSKSIRLFSETVALLITISVFVVLKSGHDKPYWLNGGMAEQSSTSTLLLNGSQIHVDPQMAEYVSRLQTLAIEGGWQTGTALIDLTGRAPGANVILGGRFLAAPYLIGGYPGSDEMASGNLAQVPLEQLKKAWILTATGGAGNKTLPADVLTDLGVNFPVDYEMIGKTTAGFLKNWQPGEQQELWRPISND